MTMPLRLYKYRAFNVNSLRLLSEAEVYYADPKSFNDPLDCNPTLHIDTDRDALEKLAFSMLKSTRGIVKAHERLNHHRYMSTEYGGNYKTDPETERYYMQMLASEVKGLLVDDFGSRGVFSLAKKWDCPLMWSHYADEHRGICIEYDAADAEFFKISAVDYERPRSIKISELISWKLNACDKAESEIFNTFFLAKAPQWKYEEEWRDVAVSNGVHFAPARITGIYFGLRCDAAVITTVVKLFSNSETPISFHNIYPHEDSFGLMHRDVDTHEIEANGLRSSTLFEFRDVLIGKTEDA